MALVSRAGELTSKTGINPVRQKRALRSLRRHPPEYQHSEKMHKKTTLIGGLKKWSGLEAKNNRCFGCF